MCLTSYYRPPQKTFNLVETSDFDETDILTLRTEYSFPNSKDVQLPAKNSKGVLSDASNKYFLNLTGHKETKTKYQDKKYDNSAAVSPSNCSVKSDLTPKSSFSEHTYNRPSPKNHRVDKNSFDVSRSCKKRRNQLDTIPSARNQENDFDDNDFLIFAVKSPKLLTTMATSQLHSSSRDDSTPKSTLSIKSLVTSKTFKEDNLKFSFDFERSLDDSKLEQKINSEKLRHSNHESKIKQFIPTDVRSSPRNKQNEEDEDNWLGTFFSYLSRGDVNCAKASRKKGSWWCGFCAIRK